MFFIACVFICILGLRASNAASLTTGGQFRIIGGVDAPERYSPYMAALIMGERLQTMLCGGSIISKRLVLTAAHCIDVVVQPDGQLIPSFRLRVGSNQWNSGGKIVQVKHYYNHPQWDPRNIKYDIGILLLKKRLVFSDSLGKIQLGFGHVSGGRRSLVTGWGRTGPRTEGNAVGDSGSALLLEKTREQIGIVSWGLNCARGAPDIYVRIEGMRPFLEPMLAIFKD